MSEFGKAIEVTTTAPVQCRCGQVAPEGAPVTIWRSAQGREYDHVITCPACERPKGIIPERMWLLKRRGALKDARFGYIYGSTVGPGGVAVQPPMPPELASAWGALDQELEENRQKLHTTLLKLLEHLPRCSECSKYATYQLRDGPFFCDDHASEHSTAQKVPWEEEIRALQPD